MISGFRFAIAVDSVVIIIEVTRYLFAAYLAGFVTFTPIIEIFQ
jgi:hypothetical protein